MTKTTNRTNDNAEINLDAAELRGELSKAQAVSENSPINIILADTDLNITYANPASVEQLKALEHLLPCRVDEIVGQSVDIFHKDPAHQRSILSNPKNLPHRANIALGEETLDLLVSAMYDDEGEYLGPMVTWEVVTEKLKLEKAATEKSAIVENAPINIILADTDGTIIYMNPASDKTLRTVEHLLPVKVDQIVGGSYDVFHKNPAHQRSILGNHNNFPHQADIEVGPEKLDLLATGISDNAYYWNELHKCLKVYCDLKKVCPELTALNIGGGFPIKRSLNFDYNYEYMAEEIVAQIKQVCMHEGVPEPNIFTEFGSFTVGESGGTIYDIIHQKQQNDRERWNMIDGSFMTTLPDAWAINQRFVMLPLNNWNRRYERILLGGLTCDSDDYYNSEQHVNAIYLPEYDPDNSVYIGFFNTGSYQEALSGFGGIQHCLIPSPKHIVIDRDEEGDITTRIFSKEQSHKSIPF